MLKLLKNIFFVSYGEFGSRLLNLVTTILLIRVFSVDDFGKINIASALYGYAILLSVHWFNTFGVKKIAAGENGKFISEFTSIRLGSSILASLLISLFLVFSNLDFQLKQLIFLFIVSLIPNAYYLDWYFQGREKFKPIANSKLIYALSYLFFLIILVAYKKDVVNVGLAFLLGNIFVAFFFLFSFYRERNQLPVLSIPNNLIILKESLPLSIGSVLSQLNTSLPIFIIGLFLGTSDVGIFSAAYKFVFFLLILDRFYYLIFFPAFMRIYKFNSQIAEEFLNSALKITVVVVLFISSILIINANELLLFVYGKDYQGSVILFQLLLIYFIITLLNSLVSSGLIAIGEERYYSKTIIYTFLLNLLLMVLLTKIYGVIGSSLTIGIVETIIFIALFLRLKRFVQFKITKYIFYVILLNSMILILGMSLNLNVLIRSIIISVVYLLGLIIFKVINKEDMILFKEKLWN